MPVAEATKRKEELLRAIRRAGAEARRPYRELLRTAEDHIHIEKIADLAVLWVVELPEELFGRADWDGYAKRWEYTGDIIVKGRWDSRAGSVVRSAGDTIAYGTMALVFDPGIYEGLPDVDKGKLTDVRESFRRLLDWQEVYDTVVGMLICKHLHIGRSGSLSPWDLLEASRTALTVPLAGRIVTANVLAPLRKAIDAVLDEVTRRLPLGSKAEGWSEKIDSILDQVAVAGTPHDLIVDLARDAKARSVDLASTDSRALSAEGVHRVFLDSLLFLSALLSGVDAAKLRPA